MKHAYNRHAESLPHLEVVMLLYYVYNYVINVTSTVLCDHCMILMCATTGFVMFSVDHPEAPIPEKVQKPDNILSILSIK